MAPRAVFFLRHSLKSHFHMADISQDVPRHFPLRGCKTVGCSFFFFIFKSTYCATGPGTLKDPCVCAGAGVLPSSQPAATCRSLSLRSSCCCHSIVLLPPTSHPSPHTINPPNPLARGSTYSRVAGVDT